MYLCTAEPQKDPQKVCTVNITGQKNGFASNLLSANVEFAYLFTPWCKRYAKLAFTTFAQIYSPVCTNLHHICADKFEANPFFCPVYETNSCLKLFKSMLEYAGVC